MKRNLALFASFALVSAALATPALAQQTTLNVVTAGDQNMVDYIKDFLAPRFEKTNPKAVVKAVGTGPGDGGSQKIAEKLQAQKNNSAWDIDVAVIHQKMAGDLVREGLLAPYVRDVATGRLVTSEASKNALGTNVAGYVIPMFQSQTAIAWNPALVKTPPKNYDDLAAWAKSNPRKFGYNGIKGGMSGVAFVVGWVYANTSDAEKLMKGPYDASTKANWDPALAKLKEFNRSVVITPGNAGTLDMLNRGEIAMGPVWVDMFYTWMADGKLPPNMRLQLIGPGMPGQPMYYVIPAKAAHAQLAKKFIDLAESPEVQADGIIKQFNWYPGIDPQYVQPRLDKAAWNKLFTDVSPQDLASYGRPFPLSPYFKQIVEGYERVVLK
jgi:putative spermidine/putrescine transport system substrate-binding protein